MKVIEQIRARSRGETRLTKRGAIGFWQRILAVLQRFTADHAEVMSKL
jgi:hypothetical protein